MFDSDMRDSTLAPEKKADLPAPYQGRVIPLPAGLTLADLQRMNPKEIDRIIKTQGAGIGWAAILALAAGVAGTPSNVQNSAAQALVKRAAELNERDDKDADIMEQLRTLDHDQLLLLIQTIKSNPALLAVELTDEGRS